MEMPRSSEPLAADSRGAEEENRETRKNKTQRKRHGGGAHGRGCWQRSSGGGVCQHLRPRKRAGLVWSFGIERTEQRACRSTHGWVGRTTEAGQEDGREGEGLTRADKTAVSPNDAHQHTETNALQPHHTTHSKQRLPQYTKEKRAPTQPNTTEGCPNDAELNIQPETRTNQTIPYHTTPHHTTQRIAHKPQRTTAVKSKRSPPHHIRDKVMPNHHQGQTRTHTHTPPYAHAPAA